MPLSPIPTRVVEVAGEDGRSISVTRWDGEPDLAAMLLLPTREELTRGYDRYGSALAELGVSVMIPMKPLEPGEDALATVERLLQVLRSERSAPPVVLAGHGIGGLLAADYLLESGRPQPDLAVLLGPDLGSQRRASLIERVVPFRRRTPSSIVEATQARVAGGLHGLPVRTRFAGGGKDELASGPMWSELMRSLRPGDAVIHPALGHDLPNESGWRDRAQELVGWILRAAREQWPDALPPAPDGERWSRMTRAEATSRHESYVATEDERLARFRDQVARRGGPELLATREGMEQLGAWLLDTIEVGARDRDRPGWATHTTGPMGRLSSESLWLIDGAASHVAASLRSLEPTLHWNLCTNRIDAYYQQTVLEPIHLAPPVPAIAIIRQVTTDEPSGQWLASAWDAWVQTLELVRANPQALDADPLPLDEVAVDPYEGDPWNAQIWIPEGAEAVLGTERFEQLGERIRRLKGVEQLAWEDREVMLVRLAPGTDHADLRRRVVTVLRRARKGAATEGG